MRSRPGQLNSIRRKRVKVDAAYQQRLENYRLCREMEEREQQFQMMRGSTAVRLEIN